MKRRIAIALALAVLVVAISAIFDAGDGLAAWLKAYIGGPGLIA